MKNALNLCATVEARVRYETLRCEVGSEPSPWCTYLAWNDYHRWPEGERSTGRCLNCGKTLAEVRVRINPKTGEPVRKPSRIAREIATMRADVPPVVFVQSSPARGAAASTRGKTR